MCVCVWGGGGACAVRPARRSPSHNPHPPTTPHPPTENVLALKDPARPFPTGAPLGVLKWRFTTKDESLVPLTINCWPSVSGEGGWWG